MSLEGSQLPLYKRQEAGVWRVVAVCGGGGGSEIEERQSEWQHSDLKCRCLHGFNSQFETISRSCSVGSDDALAPMLPR
jgi:hypothetical protein